MSLTETQFLSLALLLIVYWHETEVICSVINYSEQIVLSNIQKTKTAESLNVSLVPVEIHTVALRFDVIFKGLGMKTHLAIKNIYSINTSWESLPFLGPFHKSLFDILRERSWSLKTKHTGLCHIG